MPTPNEGNIVNLYTFLKKMNYFLSHSHHSSSSESEKRSNSVQIKDNTSSLSFSRQKCGHQSLVKWPLSVPLLLRLHALAVNHSINYLAVSSSPEEISPHFITCFHQPNSFSDKLRLGFHPRNHSYTEDHLLNTSGSKSKTTDQIEDQFKSKEFCYLLLVLVLSENIWRTSICRKNYILTFLQRQTHTYA